MQAATTARQAHQAAGAPTIKIYVKNKMN